MAVRQPEAGVAGEPHLVLADVGDVGRRVLGQLADPLDHVIGGQDAVAPGARAVPAARLALGLPGGQLLEVLGPLLDRGGLDHRGERPQDAPGVAHDRDLDRDVLADLGRVDVDMDDPGIRRVGPHVAGDPVVEAHPDRDQQVGRLDRPVDVLPAVHAHVAVGERMALVDRADPEQGPGDRDAGLLGERDEIVPGLGVEDAMAGQDHRPLGLGDLGGGHLELARVAVEVRPEAGQAGEHLGLGRVLRRGLLLEGVLGDVDVDRTGPAGPGDVECLGEDAGQVVGVADQVVVLGHRQGDAVDVDLLEGVLAEQRAGDVAGDRHDRDRIEEGGAEPGDEVRGARARGAQADAHLPGDPRIAVGRVGAALLMADEDVAQLGVVPEDVVEGQDHTTRIAEEDVDALAKERLADHVGADPAALERLGVVEHRVARLLDRGRAGGAVVGHVAVADGLPGRARAGRRLSLRLRRFALRDRHQSVSVIRLILLQCEA